MENAEIIAKDLTPLLSFKATTVGAPTTSLQTRSARLIAINHARVIQTNGAAPPMPACMGITSWVKPSPRGPHLESSLLRPPSRQLPRLVLLCLSLDPSPSLPLLFGQTFALSLSTVITIGCSQNSDEDSYTTFSSTTSTDSSSSPV